jgi:hypothetical protein
MWAKIRNGWILLIQPFLFVLKGIEFFESLKDNQSKNFIS